MPAVDCQGIAREPPHHNTSTTTRGAILRAAMLTRIEHVTIGAADLRAGIAAYRRIVFDVDERGIAANDGDRLELVRGDRKSTRLNSSHSQISYAVFCLK